MAKKKKSFFKKVFIAFSLILLITGGTSIYLVYKTIYQPNVSLGNKKSQIIYIRTGSSFEDVVNMLYEKNILVNRATFTWLAEQKKYKNAIKPGKYRILANMGNNQLINLLRAGIQEPVFVPLNNIRNKEELISRVCARIEADSLSMKQMLNDDSFLQKYGMNSESILTLFIPKSYKFYWNTSVEDFLDIAAAEYKSFWTEARRKKANDIGLSQSEVSILASIVQAEQSRFNDEKPIIAGLYMNRLKRQMPLQSDPTLICAVGDYSITRVLNEYKDINSPYNTYKYKGLPPGPVCIPGSSSIDAVLNYNHNDYLYMCAKEDFSGRHNFAKNYQQHMLNANKYRKELDRRNILR